MNATCPECRSIFRLDPARIPAHGVRARCSVCGGLIPVASAGIPGATAWGTPAAASIAVPRATPAASAMPAMPAVTTATAPLALPVSSPASPSPTPSRTPVQGLQGVPTGHPGFAPSAAPSDPRTPASSTPASSTPASAGADGVSTRPRLSGPTGARAPINPFLANDPNQKARRLARALVSDMVAYHPQQVQQGARDGTLKQLFKDEIKKSYEEYVEQVGQEFADSTGHFQDALNDILAGGRKLF